MIRILFRLKARQYRPSSLIFIFQFFIYIFAFFIYVNNAFAADTGFVTGGNAFLQSGFVNWTAANLSSAGDSAYASLGTASGYGDIYTFNIDLGSIDSIDGIEVTITAREGHGGCNAYSDIQLSWNGGAGWTSAIRTPAGTGEFATSFGSHTAGGSTELWGRSWTQTEIETFLRVRVTAYNARTSSMVDIDYVAVKVYYTPHVNVGPTFSGNVIESADPGNLMSNITFQGSASDFEGDSWYLAICGTNAVTPGIPPTCDDFTYCVSPSAASSGSSNSCNWTATSTGSKGWYAFACDNNDLLACSSANSANSPLTIIEGGRIQSMADQAFELGQAATAISAIRITDNPGGNITAANDIRIAIATTSVDMLWYTTDSIASLSGTAFTNNRVTNTTVSYEGGGAILVIEVASDFQEGEYLDISGLSFTGFDSVNTPASALELHLNGTYDSSPVKDDKLTTIYGTLASGEHTLGQAMNGWLSQTSTTTVHYRYSLTPTGEGISFGTTVFDLSGVSGVSSGDLTQARLYEDLDGDSTKDNEIWFTSYDPPSMYIYSLAFDSVNQVLYAGGSQGLFYRCAVSTGCDEDGDWTYDDLPQVLTIYSLAYDAANQVLYAGTISNIYRCAASTGCDQTGDWTLSYDTPSSIEIMILDTSNQVLYAGGVGGIIYRCAASTGCDEDGDWTQSYDSPATHMYALAFDSANQVLYAGSDSGGVIYRCAVSTGCDAAGDWTISNDTTYATINSLVFDSANQVLYAGTATFGVILRCAASTGCDEAGDWTISYDSPTSYIKALVIDTANQVLYAAGASALIYQCALSSACDAAGDWTQSFDSSENYINSLAFDSVNQVIYAGSEASGIIYRKPSQDPLIGGEGFINISGNAGTITFSTSTYYSIDAITTDFILEFSASNLASGDMMTIELGSASATGIVSDYDIILADNTSSVTHAYNPITISSAADQAFEVGQASTSNSAIRITAFTDTAITDANELYIAISTTTHDFRFYTGDTSVSITGTASNSVNNTTVTFISDSVLMITVTDDNFDTNEYIDISGLTYHGFNTAVNSAGALKLYTGGTYGGSPDASDGKTVTIYGTLTLGDYFLGQTANKWASQTSTSTVHYRYSLIPAGESMKLGTTTFYLSDLIGVNTSDISDFYIYSDFDGTGDINGIEGVGAAWGDSDSGVITYDYSGRADEIRKILIDASNNIYVGGVGAWYTPPGDLIVVGKYDYRGDLCDSSNTLCGGWGDSDSGRLIIDLHISSGDSTGIYDMAFDTDYNLYLAGFTIDRTVDVDYDWYIRKYDSNGDLVTGWGNNGAIFLADDTGVNEKAYGIKTDSSGAVYIIGESAESQPLRKYDPAGILDTSWGDNDSGIIAIPESSSLYDIEIDNENNIYVVGTGNGTTRLIKYDNNGDLCDSTNQNCGGWGLGNTGSTTVSGYLMGLPRISIDANKNIYLGVALISTYEWLILKYDPNGDLDTSWAENGEIRTSTLDLGNFDFAEIVDIRLDNNNYLYVTGSNDYDLTSGYNRNIFAIRFDDSGRLTGTWGGFTEGLFETGSSEIFDKGSTIGVDSLNNIYIGGRDESDWYLKKFSHHIFEGEVEISGTNGEIRISTSSPFWISTTTTYLLELTASNLTTGDMMTIDFGTAEAIGLVSGHTITLSENSSAVTHAYNPVTISSAANQVFGVNQASTTNSAIRITALTDTAITDANELYIAISTTTHDFRFYTGDTSVTITGTASNSVNNTTVTFISDSVLMITVTDDNFDTNEYIDISGLTYHSFNTAVISAGALKLYAGGTYSGTADAIDDKTVTIYGALSSGEHTLGQVTNKWVSQTSTTTVHYRYSLVPEGEGMTLGTTTFGFSGISGVLSSDLSDAMLYWDKDNNGIVNFASTTDPDSWAVLDTGGSTYEYIFSLAYDSANDVLYAGAGLNTGEGDILRCPNLSTGGCDEASEWAVIDTGGSTYEAIYSLVYDSGNNVLYAGAANDTGEGDILRCPNLSTGGCDEASEWAVIDTGSSTYESIYSLAYDSVNDVLYAGTGAGVGEGDILRCPNLSTGGCNEASDWIVLDTGGSVYERMVSLAYDSVNDVLYAGAGASTGDGDILRCLNASTGGCDEASDWIVLDTGGSTYEYIYSLAYDSRNGVLYAGAGSSAGEGDILRCPNASTSGWDQAGDCTVLDTGGSTYEYIYSLAYDSRNDVLYTGAGAGAGEGDILRCPNASTGGCDQAGDWTVLDTGGSTYELIRSLVYDSVNGVLYAGAGSGAGEGDILRFDPGDLLIGQADIDVSGTAGSLTFATSAAYSIPATSTDFIIQLAASNLIACDTLTIDFDSASTTGLVSGWTIEPADNSSSATHLVSPGSLTAANHSAGQIEDVWGALTGESTTDIHFRFRLDPGGDSMSLGTTTISLSSVSGVESADITAIKLYLDADSDGIVSVGDTQVNGNGAISIANGSGSIVFATSSTYALSSITDYIIELTASNLESGAGGGSGPAIVFEGSFGMEGGLDFEGMSGGAADTMTIDLDTIESAYSCSFDYAENVTSVMHQR